MKMNALIFVIGFIVAFAGGYLFFGGDEDGASQPADTPQETETTEDTGTESEEETASDDATGNDEEAAADESADEETEEQAEGQTASVDIQPMGNCLSCHAVDSLGVPGGEAGPDLSGIYAQIEGKHGKDLDSFLQEPTTQVMVTVLEDPLEDEEREAIVDILRQASEEIE